MSLQWVMSIIIVLSCMYSVYSNALAYIIGSISIECHNDLCYYFLYRSREENIHAHDKLIMTLVKLFLRVLCLHIVPCLT